MGGFFSACGLTFGHNGQVVIYAPECQTPWSLGNKLLNILMAKINKLFQSRTSWLLLFPS